MRVIAGLSAMLWIRATIIFTWDIEKCLRMELRQPVISPERFREYHYQTLVLYYMSVLISVFSCRRLLNCWLHSLTGTDILANEATPCVRRIETNSCKTA